MLATGGVTMPIRTYRELIVWQKAMDLVVSTYEMTRSLPREEQFGLTSQMRRAAISIVANLAEGSVRTKKEFLHFVTIARGSLKELEALTSVCQRLDYITPARADESAGLQDEVGAMLWSLRARLSRT